VPDAERPEGGFTLIELMLVVLILGILMAIALPTYLALTSSARSTGIESNLQIALADENMYFSAHGAYGTPAGIATLDSGVAWKSYSGAIVEPAPTKDVWVDGPLAGPAGTTAVILGAGSGAGTFAWVYEDLAAGIVRYEQTATATAPAPSSFVATSWKAT